MAGGANTGNSLAPLEPPKKHSKKRVLPWIVLVLLWLFLLPAMIVGWRELRNLANKQAWLVQQNTQVTNVSNETNQAKQQLDSLSDEVDTMGLQVVQMRNQNITNVRNTPLTTTGAQGPSGTAGTQGASGSASCTNGLCLSVQTNLLGLLQLGDLQVGTLVANVLQGVGSAITNLNASNIVSGVLSDGLLSPTVTLLGNTFNGVNQLVKLDGSGVLPALDGTLLTNLDAQQLNGQLSSYYTDVTNMASGILNDARLGTNVTLQGNGFNGLGQLVQLDGVGALPVLDGVNLTNVDALTLGGNGTGFFTDASNIVAGTLNDGRLGNSVTLLGNTFNGANQLVQATAGGALPVISGANLTTLSADNISSGILGDGRLSGTVTLQGNGFNGANQLLQLNGSSQLPAVNASLLTSLNASNLTSGALDDGRLSANVTVQGNAFNGTSQLVRTTAGGALPGLSGANLTSLSASSITSGVLSDSRLSSNVALLNSVAPLTFETTTNFVGSLLSKLDSTAAFQIQNTSNASVLVADTSSMKITLGDAGATPVLLVLGNKNTGGDPAGSNGALYYNSSSNRLRCYENSSWRNCMYDGPLIGYAQATSNQTGITAEVDLTGLTTTVNVPAGHKVRITAQIGTQSTFALDVASLVIKEGGTQLQACGIGILVAAGTQSTSCSAILSPSAGAHTYKLSMLRVAGLGNLSLNASGTQPSFIMVEDLGPGP